MADNTTNNKIITTVELDANKALRQIAKLNSSASDTTKKLEDRIRDKNEEVKLQNQLSKKTISDLEKERNSLVKSGASLKEVTKSTKKLNAEKLKATKISARNTKQQNKLNASNKQSAKGFGFLSKGLASARAGVLGMIPALGGLTTAIAATGIGALVIAVVALGAGMLSAIKVGAKFSKSLSTLKAISAATNEEMAVLSDQAKELGSTTAFTASQVVELQTEFAKLGFSVKEISEATPSVLDLAASLDVDLASAAMLAGSLVKSFGLETSDTQMVVDLLAKTASSSAQDFGTIVESFKVAAPAARALGVSIQETSALLGALANNGLKGSVAGTGLSKTFIELKKKGLTLEEGLAQVRNSSDSLGTALDLVGVVGSKSLLTLANSGEDIEKLSKDLENVEGGALGAAKAMAEIKLDNLAGDTTKLSSAWEGFILGIEDGSGGLNDLARGAVQLLTKAITGLGFVIDVIGFTFKDQWLKIKTVTEASSDIVIGAFTKLGANIMLFANEAMLAIADIPIIGKAIDKKRIEDNIKIAEKALSDSSKRISNGQKLFAEQRVRDLTMQARFIESQKTSALKQSEAKLRKVQEEESAKRLEQEQKLSKEAEEAAKRRAEKELESAKKSLDKLKSNLEKQEDLLEDARQREIEGENYKLEEKKRSLKEELDANKELNKAARDSGLIDEATHLENLLDLKKNYDAQVQLATDEAAAIKKQKADLAEQGALDSVNAIVEADRIAKEDAEAVLYEEKAILEAEREIEKLEKLQEGLDKESAAYKAVSDLIASTEIANSEKIANARIRDEQQAAKVKKLLVNQGLNDAKSSLQGTQDLAGEGSAVGQAAAIAQATISGVQGVQNAYSTAQSSPITVGFPAYPIVQAALAGAVAVKNLATIKKTKSPGQKSGGGGGGGGIPSISSAVSSVGQSSVGDLAANNASRLGTNTSLTESATSAAVNSTSASGGNQVVFSESGYSSFQQQVAFKEGKATID